MSNGGYGHSGSTVPLSGLVDGWNVGNNGGTVLGPNPTFNGGNEFGPLSGIGNANGPV
jgi:hypothetical protein